MLVSRAFGIGLTRDEVGHMLGISPKSVSRHYGQEIAGAIPNMNFNVASNLYRIATGDSKAAVTAAIFWMKTRAGWKDTSRVEIETKTENTTVIEVVNARLLTPEARDELRATLEEALARQKMAALPPPIEGDFAVVSEEDDDED